MEILPLTVINYWYISTKKCRENGSNNKSERDLDWDHLWLLLLPLHKVSKSTSTHFLNTQLQNLYWQKDLSIKLGVKIDQKTSLRGNLTSCVPLLATRTYLLFIFIKNIYKIWLKMWVASWPKPIWPFSNYWVPVVNTGKYLGLEDGGASTALSSTTSLPGSSLWWKLVLGQFLPHIKPSLASRHQNHHRTFPLIPTFKY